MRMVATNIEPQPKARPKFQPEKWPEMTAPTPSAQSEKHARVAPQLALREVLRAHLLVLDARRSFVGHVFLLHPGSILYGHRIECKP